MSILWSEHGFCVRSSKSRCRVKRGCILSPLSLLRFAGGWPLLLSSSTVEDERVVEILSDLGVGVSEGCEEGGVG